MEQVSRRSFLKAAAVGTAGIASASLLAACAPQNDSDAKTSASGASVSTGDVSFDEEFDIVVVGAGTAGLAAALTSATEGNGVTTLLLEKGMTPSGNSPFCDNASLWTDNADDMFNYLKDLSGDFAPTDEIIRSYAEGFEENPGWLKTFDTTGNLVKTTKIEAHQLEYPEYGSDKGCVGLLRVAKPDDEKNTRHMHAFMLELVQKNDGIDYRPGNPAEGLIQDPLSKRILGVTAKGKNIKANKGVVLSLGGFENSPEYLQCFVHCGNALPAAATGNTGDGIKWTMAAGAHLWHMSGWAGAWMSPVNLETGVFLLPGVEPARQKIKIHGITVANNGRRFYMDADGHNMQFAEDMERYPTMNRHVGSRHGHMQFGGEWPNLPMPTTAWYVFDSEGLAAGAMGKDYAGDPVAEKWAYSAATIEDLATQMDVPADELTRTVNQWNVWCEQGDDLAFYRPKSTLAPLSTPPYYAMKCNSAFLNTDGGPERNVNGQIVTPDGEPILGLYGAGEFGSFWGNYYQGAGNIGECLVSARIAVRHMLSA